MTQSVLGSHPQTFRKQLHIRIGLCVAAGLFTLGINILLALLRTDSNRIFMLAANIASDILCGCILLYYTQMHLRPKMQLLRLCSRQREQVTGTITGISSQPRRYMDLDCYAVTVNERTVFLPANTLELTQQTYTFYLVSNVIVEVAQ